MWKRVTMAFSTPRKLTPKVCIKSILDNFDEAVLRKIVHNFYLTETQRPTLKKTSDNRKFIVERHDIRSLRVKYLRAIRAYRKEGRPIVYADETYIHSSYTASYAWDDGSGAGLKDPLSKGRRLIIVYAGNSTLSTLY